MSLRNTCITLMGSLVDSFWDRGKGQLSNGQFDHMMNSTWLFMNLTASQEAVFLPPMSWLTVHMHLLDRSFQLKHRAKKSLVTIATRRFSQKVPWKSADLPFIQLRFHCNKQQGLTYHVTTVTNISGEAAVQYFSGQIVANGNTKKMKIDYTTTLLLF